MPRARPHGHRRATGIRRPRQAARQDRGTALTAAQNQERRSSQEVPTPNCHYANPVPSSINALAQSSGRFGNPRQRGPVMPEAITVISREVAEQEAVLKDI